MAGCGVGWAARGLGSLDVGVCTGGGMEGLRFGNIDRAELRARVADLRLRVDVEAIFLGKYEIRVASFCVVWPKGEEGLELLPVLQ